MEASDRWRNPMVTVAEQTRGRRKRHSQYVSGLDRDNITVSRRSGLVLYRYILYFRQEVKKILNSIYTVNLRMCTVQSLLNKIVLFLASEHIFV